MKKLTKKEKEIFKKKIFKILNIVSYILSGIFVVFLVISFVQSCSPKSDIINDLTQTTETRQAQRLQEGTQDYMLPVGTLGIADIDNPFPIDSKSSAYVLTNFIDNSFCVTGAFVCDFFSDLTLNNRNMYYFKEGIYANFLYHAYYNGELMEDDSYTGRVYTLQYLSGGIDSNTGVLTYTYQFHTQHGYIELPIPYTNRQDNFYMDIYVMFTALENGVYMSDFLTEYCTFMYPTLNTNDLFNYANAIINNDEMYTTSYELPPYLIIEKDVQSFVYNIGGSLGLLRFDKIIYEYHKSLYFTTTGGNRYVWNYDININGDYVFTPKMTTTDYISGSGQSGTIPLYRWYDNIIDLTFTSYGTLGKSFIDKYFINTNNDLLNNTYNLNASYFLRLLTSELVVSIESDYTLQFLPHNNDFSFENPNYSMDLDMKLLVNDNYYKSITFRYGLNINTTLPTLGAIYIYTNIDNNYYDNPTLSPLLLGIEYINNQFTLTSDLLDVSQNDFLNKANLKLFNVDISSDLWNLVGTAFIPYELTGNFDIVYGDNDNVAIGNVFTLLGGAFGGLAGLMGISILPGITLGILLFIPLIILIILFIVHLFKR